MSYVFLNPATGQEEMKHTWAVKRDGILFGSGWYERYIGAPLGKSDPAAFTVAFVERAIDRYDREGREASFAYFDSEESEDGQWYVSVLEDGRIATHPTESLRGDRGCSTDRHQRVSLRAGPPRSDGGGRLGYVRLPEP